jgi:hypothetical protein
LNFELYACKAGILSLEHTLVHFALVVIFIYFLAVLGSELRAYTLSHSTSPVL